MRRVFLALALLQLGLGIAPALAQEGMVPNRLNQCVSTEITRSGSLQGTRGTMIQYRNGLHQSSCKTELAAQRSRPRDRVRLCLVRVNNGIPPSRVFSATNERTGESWTLPDKTDTCE